MENGGFMSNVAAWTDAFEFSTNCSKLGKQPRILEIEDNGEDKIWDCGVINGLSI